MNNTALQIREASGLNLKELETIGQVFVKSGFFAETRDAAQAIVKVMAGAELGFPAIASMTGVYIVKGKVSLSANLMAAAIKRSGKYNYKVRQLDEAGCKIEFFEGGESLGVSSFMKADAQNAGFVSETWKKFFRNMAFARALSNGAKWFCPDIFGGPIYTPDELGATVDGETGEVIEMPRDDDPVVIVKPEPEPIVEVDERQAHGVVPFSEAKRRLKPEDAQPTNDTPSVTATEFWKSVRKWKVPEKESSDYAQAAIGGEITWAEALNTLREMYG